MYWGQPTLTFGIILILMGVVQLFTRRAWAKQASFIVRALGLRRLEAISPKTWEKIALPLIGPFFVVGLFFVVVSGLA